MWPYFLSNIGAASWENKRFAYAKTKTQISFVVTAKLISALVFTTWIVQSVYLLNPKFQASSHLQWLYSLVCVRPGQIPHCWFSHVAAHRISVSGVEENISRPYHYLLVGRTRLYCSSLQLNGMSNAKERWFYIHWYHCWLLLKYKHHKTYS